ncbi:hypothetical protein CHU98_g5841 [Xylaria longipes]|nr:hypothetical protein CHU98_g5841 [Xylaria longipes]
MSQKLPACQRHYEATFNMAIADPTATWPYAMRVWDAVTGDLNFKFVLSYHNYEDNPHQTQESASKPMCVIR